MPGAQPLHQQCQPRRRRPPSAKVTLEGGAGTPAGAVSSICAWNALAEGPGAAGSAGGRSPSSTQVAFMAAAAKAYSSLICSMYAGVGVSAQEHAERRSAESYLTVTCCWVHWMLAHVGAVCGATQGGQQSLTRQ